MGENASRSRASHRASGSRRSILPPHPFLGGIVPAHPFSDEMTCSAAFRFVAFVATQKGILSVARQGILSVVRQLAPANAQFAAVFQAFKPFVLLFPQR